MLDVTTLTHEELKEKCLELEHVLSEFQDSSNELEQALEDELRDLEARFACQEAAYKALEARAVHDRNRAEKLSRELNDLFENTRNKAREWEETRTRLTHQLVLVEIANDTMETNDRAIQQQLAASQKLNNTLLEKLALVEHDLDRERAASASKQLYIENYQREVRELNEKIESLAKNVPGAASEADVLMISMREVLRTGPPSAYFNQSILPRSSSLQKLHAMQREVAMYMNTPAPQASTLQAERRNQTLPESLTRRDVSANNELPGPGTRTASLPKHLPVVEDEELDFANLPHPHESTNWDDADGSKSGKKRSSSSKRKLLELPSSLKASVRRTRNGLS